MNIDDKKRLRTKTIIFLTVTIALFAALMIIGTFWDLQISKSLTKNSLAAGEYYSSDVFALECEAYGSTPIWLAFCFAFALLYVFVTRLKVPTWLKVVLCAVCVVAAVFVSYKAIIEIFEYLAEQNGVQELIDVGAVKGSALFIGVIVFALVFLLTVRVKLDRKTLVKVALVLLCSCALYLVVSVIKTPVGRVRFRTINTLGDESLFTPWYVVNCKRTFAGLPGDCCKSFPSGHTFSAGMIFLLLLLPDLFDWANKRWLKIVLWVCCGAYVVCVAVSRIIAGAHYLTDVTVGGFLALWGVTLFREIFIKDFAHFKSLKKE